MLNLILRLFITAVALKGADVLLPNFNLHGGLQQLIFFTVVLGLLNWLIKPILVFFSVPLLILTVGLFYIIINALLIYCASLILPGVLSGTTAGIFFGSIIVSILHWILSIFSRLRKKND